MELGIDLGTSEVKAVAIDEDRVVATAGTPLTVSRPHLSWSEQNPADWWAACQQSVVQLRAEMGTRWRQVNAIGLTGQMHGAVLLDGANAVLRPAILWNDTRSAAECAWLERNVPALRPVTGNIAMPGFTAPKLVWVRTHEPAVFAAVRKVLLPKDWLRLQMTGAAVSDMSDAAGTLWLDVAARHWSGEMLAACGLTEAHMPALVEGSQVSARLLSEVAAAWGLPPAIPVAGGGGDNAATAVGIGATQPGQGFVSLGTSGVVFVVNDRFRPNPADAVHAFCHALPERWHQMAVTLSAASSLKWARELTHAADDPALAAEAETLGSDRRREAPLFLPYLSGERTPYNDAQASGVFYGLRGGHGRPDLAYAVMEGVAFSLADGIDALRRAGSVVDDLSFVGGGSRSEFWGRLISSAAELHLVTRDAGDVGAAFGAARLARLAATGEDPARLSAPRARTRISPDAELAGLLAPRRILYRALYPALRAVYAPDGPKA